jgi:hypothetical protein
MLRPVIVFEVHLTPGADDSDLLSDELRQETQAQVMTAAEARAIGFEGLPDDPNLRLVACAREHAKWVEKALERAPQVRGYQPHEVDM